jgi:fatty-acyl-CoA synthase
MRTTRVSHAHWEGLLQSTMQNDHPLSAGALFTHGLRLYPDSEVATFDGTGLRRVGFVRMPDRAKDVIESGGEWMSSADLEAHIMAHPDFVEAAIIGVPDRRWEERPLACVVLHANATTNIDALSDFLRDRVPRWWIPEQSTLITEPPRPASTSSTKEPYTRFTRTGALRVVHRQRTAHTSPSTIGT